MSVNWILENCIFSHMYSGEKDLGPTILDGLPNAAYSQARSHYCPTRGLLPAAFPPWAGSSLLRQPGHPRLLRGDHIDAELSADTRSTYHDERQEPRPQVVHQTRPPSHWITGKRRSSVASPLVPRYLPHQ